MDRHRALRIELGDSRAAATRLRVWYLARLRRLALDEEGKLNYTPGTLVRADIERLEKLIGSRQDLRTIESGKRKCNSFAQEIVPRSVLGPLVVLAALLSCVPIVTLGAAGQIVPCACAIAAAAIYLLVAFARSIHAKQIEFAESDLRKMTQPESPNPNPSSSHGLESLLQQCSEQILLLRERERLIADYSSLVVCIIDADLQFVAVSPNCRRSWGTTPPEMIGLSLEKFVYAADWSAVQLGFERAKETRQEVQVALRFITRFEGKQDFCCTVEWSNSQGCFFITAENVTSEKEIARLRERLLAVIVHDLRAPLSSFRHGLDAIYEDYGSYFDDAGHELFDCLNTTIAYLMTVVNDLVDLNRIDAIGLDLVKQSCSLKTLVEQAIAAVGPMAARKRIDINSKVLDCPIEVDCVRITRVLVNILSNAIKFSVEPGPINISAREEDRSVVLAINDSGRGIKQENLSRIFDRYQQLYADDASIGGGAGLGLAICQEIIAAHAGQIWAESEGGKGSTFFVRLPKQSSQTEKLISLEPTDGAVDLAISKSVSVPITPGNGSQE